MVKQTGNAHGVHGVHGKAHGVHGKAYGVHGKAHGVHGVHGKEAVECYTGVQRTPRLLQQLLLLLPLLLLLLLLLQFVHCTRAILNSSSRARCVGITLSFRASSLHQARTCIITANIVALSKESAVLRWTMWRQLSRAVICARSDAYLPLGLTFFFLSPPRRSPCPLP
eukprot:365469-Chlamydomonas_euryale.AAC.5